MMKGYFNNFKATAETIDQEGWLHTGDIGHYDDQGILYIADRRKELIKFKAFQVFLLIASIFEIIRLFVIMNNCTGSPS